jgi:ribosome biogenesis GTPase A
MTVIDNILNEWSFRCHDGIVDINDPIKLSILNEILGFDLDEAKSGLEKWKKYFADSEVETVIKKDSPIFDEKGKKTGDIIKAGETITTQVVSEYQPKIPVLYNGNIILIKV